MYKDGLFCTYLQMKGAKWRKKMAEQAVDFVIFVLLKNVLLNPMKFSHSLAGAGLSGLFLLFSTVVSLGSELPLQSQSDPFHAIERSCPDGPRSVSVEYPGGVWPNTDVPRTDYLAVSQRLHGAAAADRLSVRTKEDSVEECGQDYDLVCGMFGGAVTKRDVALEAEPAAAVAASAPSGVDPQTPVERKPKSAAVSGGAKRNPEGETRSERQDSVRLDSVGRFQPEVDTIDVVRPYVRPPFLKEGDTVAVVAVSSKLPKRADTTFVRKLEAWGLKVKVGEHLYCRNAGWFAGTDEQRAADLQRALNDTSVKAIIFYKGGYGAIRTLDYLDWSVLRDHPKWLAGFSDVTVLHQVMRRERIESIHGTMPSLFLSDTTKRDSSALSLRDALFGRVERYHTAPSPYNRMGCATGRLVGGNLSILYALNNTDLDNHFEEPTVLFIEDVGENIYHIDRMMQNLLRSGKLARVRAIVVGYFNRMNSEREWGGDAYMLINSYTSKLGIPVLFGFPAGHARPNLSLYLGRQVRVEVTDKGGELEFL